MRLTDVSSIECGDQRIVRDLALYDRMGAADRSAEHPAARYLEGLYELEGHDVLASK